MTTCDSCGTTKTYIRHDGRIYWYGATLGRTLCRTCYDREIGHPKSNPRRLVFKGKVVFLHYNPRTGICAVCNRSVLEGEIPTTSLHHIKYHPDNPLKDTIETCNRDHRLIHAGKIVVMA